MRGVWWSFFWVHCSFKSRDDRVVIDWLSRWSDVSCSGLRASVPSHRQHQPLEERHDGGRPADGKPLYPMMLYSTHINSNELCTLLKVIPDVSSADLPSGDDGCVRQEEHAQSRLLHSRAEVWIWIRGDCSHILWSCYNWFPGFWSLVLVCSCFVWDSRPRSTTSAGRSGSQVKLQLHIYIVFLTDQHPEAQLWVYKASDVFCRGGDQ